MRRLTTIILTLVCATELLAVPVPDVVFYGGAWLDSVPVTSGNIMGTVGGQTFFASFASDGGTDYYILRIRADNLIGGHARPGAILIDEPDPAVRTLSIEIEGTLIYQGPILLTEGGTRRMDIAAYQLTTPACGDPMHPYPEGDLNQDCLVNMLDFAILGNDWMNSFSLLDLAEMADNWLESTAPELEV